MDSRYAEPLHEILARQGRFGHDEHLELAWRYVRSLPLEEAESAMAEAIRHVARTHGMPDRYHDTLTRVWLRLVAVHAARSSADSFTAFLAEHGGLRDRGLPERHYSAERLWSDTARQAFVTPDLRPLPPVARCS